MVVSRSIYKLSYNIHILNFAANLYILYYYVFGELVLEQTAPRVLTAINFTWPPEQPGLTFPYT